MDTQNSHIWMEIHFPAGPSFWYWKPFYSVEKMIKASYVSLVSPQTRVWNNFFHFSEDYSGWKQPIWKLAVFSNGFYFHPDFWWNDPIWLISFQRGWFNQPPTSTNWCFVCRCLSFPKWMLSPRVFFWLTSPKNHRVPPAQCHPTSRK